MRKVIFLAMMCVVPALFAQNILDKQMGTFDADPAWEEYSGQNAAATLTKAADFVNFTKTATGQSGYWAWLKPAEPFDALVMGTAYSIEVKARLHPIGVADDGSNYEANQISLRASTENLYVPIYLKYGDASTGYISTKSGGDDAYHMNTAEEQVYRILLNPDHKTYNVYVEGIDGPVFENVATSTHTNENGIYIGAESRHRCNIDVMYVKMDAGDLFSKANIASVELSQSSQAAGVETKLDVTVHTALIENGTKMQCSLIDASTEKEAVPPVEAEVTDNVASTELTIPAVVPVGVYAVKVEAKDNADILPKTASYEVKTADRLQWDVMDRVFSEKAWNEDPAWSYEKGGNVPADFIEQQDGYVHIYKTQAAGSYNYGFLTSPAVDIRSNTSYTYEVKAKVGPIDKTQFPDDELKPAAGDEGGYEGNQIAFQLNSKLMSVYVTYGDETKPGYVASHIIDGTGIGPSTENRKPLNTSIDHTYRLIYHSYKDRYDVYVDGDLYFEDIQLINKESGNVAKIGGESWQRCNLYVASVQLGTGDLNTGDKPAIATMDLSSDSHVNGNERTIQVTAQTLNVADGEKISVKFTDEEDEPLLDAVEMTVQGGTGTADLTIPATVPMGKYKVTLSLAGDDAVASQSMQYVVTDVSPIDTKMLPQVKTVGYVREIEDYQYYTGNKEFIFPSIVDTKKYTDENGNFKHGGGKPIDRYYLYYAPHDNPGGIYLSTGPTLDGPWTEYPGSEGMEQAGTVMDFEWARKQSPIIENGAERHISACQVVWNEDQQKFIMYFHGPNTSTHYATSDDLVNWTFGKTILVASQFSAIGAEASYAKAFEHEIPGLGNKYVMLLMNQENQIRRIYWAHSKDGINWTPVPKPLVSPDLDYKKVPGTDYKPDYDGDGGPGPYGNNVSGPYLFVVDGRYFVICHGCEDNLMVVEVGEAFDMEVHWGEYIWKKDVILGGEPTRVAAPDFIQDDNGTWYMFFEAGSRLGANIAYAKEGYVSNVPEVSTMASVVSLSRNVLNAGESFIVSTRMADKQLEQAEFYALTGHEVDRVVMSDRTSQLQAPDVPGMYILRVYTDDHISKEFEIVVK